MPSDEPPTTNPYAYIPLPDESGSGVPPGNGRRRINLTILISSILLAVGLVVTLMAGIGLVPSPAPAKVSPASIRGVEEGVSEKSFRPLLGAPAFSWSSSNLDWERSSFHFQPRKNWMNGPLFYKGWYHLFYQYNPEGATWGNKIVWGHAASRDMIHWHHLPNAMVADHWYDVNGVWTGSATILPDGQVVMLYTGSTNESVQVQNLAYPADLADPLLVEWVKYPGNPVLVPPPGIHFKDFRDPTTAWLTSEDTWRITIGSKVNKTGIALVYDTKDFKTFELLDGVLHAVPGTGMWECVDFYPVSQKDKVGLDTSASGPGVKHVMKASLDDDRNDYYALGTYDEGKGTWVPDEPKDDVGIGKRYDYGIYYASKTFYDQNKKRRVLWSWIKETDSENTDVMKGWASVQGIPRTILFDKKTGSNILQWPVEEIEWLRSNSKEFHEVEVAPGSIVPVDIDRATQLDVTAEFELDKHDLERLNESNTVYNCGFNGGASHRGAMGPFGLLVLSDENFIEQTPVYFYVSKDSEGNLTTFFCIDQSRSSEATDVDKSIYGSTVPVLKDETLTMRILVDHSIVESFAQGGRTCITSRVYPTKAIYSNARLFLFNNATDTRVKASLKVWKMNDAHTASRAADPRILIKGGIKYYALLIVLVFTTIVLL
ncbi:hypothetical protein LguiB_028727 [Lonicera macranthoides]